MTTFGRRTWAHWIIVLWVPLFLPIPTDAMPPTPHCPLVTCGGVNITYPFWVLPSTPTNNATFCGYMDLNLTCDPRNTTMPTLRTHFGSYSVKNFNGAERTVTLLHPDVDANTKGKFTRVRRNFTLQGAGVRELQYGPQVLNLTFFYNCSGEKSEQIPDEHHIRSLSSGSNRSYVFIDTAINPTYTELYGKCQPPLIAPVMRSAVDGLDLSQVFSKALNEGFQLLSMHQALDDCEWCERNKGYCGGGSRKSVAVHDDFLCFCEDGKVETGNCSRNATDTVASVRIGKVECASPQSPQLTTEKWDRAAAALLSVP